MPWRCTAFEDLDDDHTTAAAWASGLAVIDGTIGIRSCAVVPVPLLISGSQVRALVRRQAKPQRLTPLVNHNGAISLKSPERFHPPTCDEAGQGAGELSNNLKPAQTARFLVNGLQGALLRCKVDRTSAALVDFEEIIFGLLLHPEGKGAARKARSRRARPAR